MGAEVVDVLRRARARIEDPAKWAKHWSPQWWDDPTCPVCAVQAVYLAAGGVEGWRSGGARHLLGEAVGTDWLGYWNDAPERTHAEVLAAFDRAIELAEASC